MERHPTTPVTRPLYLGSCSVPVTLEYGLWSALDDICAREKQTLEAIIGTLSDEWLGDDLPSALWQYAISYYRSKSRPVSGDDDPASGTLVVKALGDTGFDG